MSSPEPASPWVPLVRADTGRILVVDDDQVNCRIVAEVLREQGHEVFFAADGEEALERVRADRPDLVISDVVMPKLDGYEVCRRLREDPATALLPIVLLSALDPQTERVTSIDAGADDFLVKPVIWLELLARVRSLLRAKFLQDAVSRQALALREANRRLEDRVREQGDAVAQLDRMKRFFPPMVAEAIVTGGADILKPHRRRINAVFVDLRGFTAFTDRADPEEVLELLRAYHSAVGKLVDHYGGTLEHFAGDGMLIFFNDPVPIERPAECAVRMAVEALAAFEPIAKAWREQGQEVGLGIGISQGAATMGLIGFENRLEYAAIGNVPNLAARLCGQAKAGEIVFDSFTQRDVADIVEADAIGMLTLRGFTQPVSAYRFRALKS